MAEFFKTKFFSVIKEGCSGGVVAKYWLTGVLPVFRDGISPLTATTVVSRWPEYSGLCGLTEQEVQAIATKYLDPTHSDIHIAQVIQQVKLWFNGYRFCPGSSTPLLYSPQQVFTYLRAARLGRPHEHPDADANVTHTANVLKAISIHGDVSVNDLFPLLSGGFQARIATELGAAEVRQLSKSASVTWGLLYYFGVVTHGEKTGTLEAPNTTMKSFVGIFRDT